MVRDPRRVLVHAIRHPRGCRSYLVIDPGSREACVVDPLLEHVRDTLDAIQEHHASVRWIVETHAHGDHLSGAAALHQRTGAEIVTHAAHPAEAATRRAHDGDTLALGEQHLVLHHAPGITADALVVEAPGAFFTGDTLLIGTVGLRDAPGSDADAWFDTLRRLFDARGDETVIHPGHDDMGRTMTTLGAERRGNRWLREDDRDAFLTIAREDDREPGKEADRILEANRAGLTKVPRELASSGFASPVEREAKARQEQRSPLTPVAEPPTHSPASGAAGLLTLGGLLAAAGTVLGWTVNPALHALSLLAALLLLGTGLPAWEARRRRRRQSSGELFYGGAPKHVVDG